MNEFDREDAIVAKFGGRSRPGSGNRPGRPEDGATKIHFLFQSKRTASEKQITIRKQDFKDLSYHAGIEHRIPIFLATMGVDTIVCIREEHLQELITRARSTNFFEGDFFEGTGPWH